MFNDMQDDGTVWDKQELTDLTKPQGVASIENKPLTRNEFKGIMGCGLFLLGLILLALALASMSVVKVDATDWVVCQRINGHIEVLDRAGYHLKLFAKTWTYKRYSTVRMEDNCYFQKGRLRRIHTFARVKMPDDILERVLLHRMFNGKMRNIEETIDGAVTNAIKTSASIMTATHYHVEGKGRMEMTKMVQDQLENGLYTIIQDTTWVDDKQVITTRIATDEDGNYLYATEPVLSKYGLTLESFGIVSTDVPPDDEMTEALGMESETSWSPPKRSLASRMPLIR